MTLQSQAATLASCCPFSNGAAISCLALRKSEWLRGKHKQRLPRTPASSRNVCLGFCRLVPLINGAFCRDQRRRVVQLCAKPRPLHRAAAVAPIQDIRLNCATHASRRQCCLPAREMRRHTSRSPRCHEPTPPKRNCFTAPDKCNWEASP